MNLPIEIVGASIARPVILWTKWHAVRHISIISFGNPNICITNIGRTANGRPYSPHGQIVWQIGFSHLCVRKARRFRRVRMGIYTVLGESFSPQDLHRPWNTPSIPSSSGSLVRRNLPPKTAKHSKARDFSARQITKSTARLTPAVDFWCSIAGKDSIWSV